MKTVIPDVEDVCRKYEISSTPIASIAECFNQQGKSMTGKRPNADIGSADVEKLSEKEAIEKLDLAVSEVVEDATISEEVILAKCPICAGAMKSYDGMTFCPKCAGVHSVIKSNKSRAVYLTSVYSLLLQATKNPELLDKVGLTAQLIISGGIPKHLHPVEVVKTVAEIDNKTSTLSVMERKLVINTIRLCQLLRSIKRSIKPTEPMAGGFDDTKEEVRLSSQDEISEIEKPIEEGELTTS
jgi:hypothetical protein